MKRQDGCLLCLPRAKFCEAARPWGWKTPLIMPGCHFLSVSLDLLRLEVFLPFCNGLARVVFWWLQEGESEHKMVCTLRTNYVRRDEQANRGRRSAAILRPRKKIRGWAFKKREHVATTQDEISPKITRAIDSPDLQKLFCCCRWEKPTFLLLTVTRHHV